MDPFLQPLRRLFGILNGARGLWMISLFLGDSRLFFLPFNHDRYSGIGIDRHLILTVSAMPLKLLCILAGFQFGRFGDVSAEAVSAVLYCVAAWGIWRWKHRLVGFASFLLATEAFTLALCLRYAGFTTLLPEFRMFALLCGAVFFTLYSASAIYLIRQMFSTWYSVASPAEKSLPPHRQ